jgi:hypothetical protein
MRYRRDSDIEIEIYKGQSILYDPEDDKFKCEISIEDKSKNTKRQSLKDVRREIDTFAKANVGFKPFKILIAERHSGKDFQVYHVESLRTDGKFLVKREDQLRWSGSFYGKKEMEEAMIYDPKIVAERQKLKDDFQALQTKYYEDVDKLAKRLKPMDLSRFEGILK